MEIITFIIVVVCGFGIGMLSGMFGIGGGGMIVPLLHMAFGLPILAATSTSLLTIAPTGLSGAYKHIRQKTISLKTGFFIGGAGAVASVGTSLIAGTLPEAFVVFLTAALILFSVGMMVQTIVVDMKNQKKAAQEEAEIQGDKATVETKASKTEENAAKDEGSVKQGVSAIVLPILIGFIAGGIAGVIGVGGGFIIIPFCVSYLKYPLKKAAGTSLLSIAIIAIPGIISHALLGHIEWLYGLAIIIGTIPGAQIGATIIARMPERPMRIAFACLLTVLGVMMLAKEFML